MTMLRTRLRHLAWIALAAMLGLALVPTLSHALARSRQLADPSAEICTPAGAPALPGNGAARDAPAALAHALVHCPLCVLAASALGAPPAATAQAPLAGEGRPALLAQPARVAHGLAWLQPQPRAPPALR
jgi:hypothetical protein